MADTCGPGRLARAALAFGRFDTLAFEPPRCTLCLIRAFSPWILPQLRHVPTRSTDQAAEHEDHPYDNCPARLCERAVVERLVSDAVFFHGYSVSHSEASARRGQKFAE
jgi:hypothetical protein